ncbi:MAG: carotenoid biosynthesis protein [Myxococcales bacterium]|nr:carotenoid biosynthesis protein [Myxococcales bacterium]
MLRLDLHPNSAAGEGQSVSPETTTVEWLCIAVLALAVALRTRGPAIDCAAERAIGIGLGALLTEHSCISAYGFYHYSPGWHGWAGHVPVLIGAIWVVVVLSAEDIAGAVWPNVTPGARHAALVGSLVVADAALVEPIATHAGLWLWHEPGAFGVPWIGMLGWGCFAAAASYWGRAVPRIPLGRLATPTGAHHDVLGATIRVVGVGVASAATTHVLLLAAWWGALRWTGRSEAPVVCVSAAAWACACVAVLACASLRRRVPFVVLAPRLAPAAFFFGLLAASPAPAALIAYAAAFVPPWAALAVGGARKNRTCV